MLRAIRTGTGCDRVYQWATMDAYPHFHVWLLPWRTTSQTRGPDHLVETIHRPCASTDALAAANAIRSALASS